MTYNQLSIALLFLAVLIFLIEFNKIKKFNFVMILVSLYFLTELLMSNNIWHLNFLSNDFWRNVIMLLVLISFIGVLNMIKDHRFEIIALNIMVFTGSVMIILCDHLIIIYLGLELQTFSLFILISKNKISIKGSEAGLKYFILGALSSGLFLLGTSFIFTTGLSLNLKDIYINGGFEINSIKIAIILICLSLFFKLAIFPLHFWIPDIYEGSSWEVITLLSTLPKISVLSIILQILGYSNLFILCALASIIVGTIGALNQTKLKRLLAYSGISHMGFIMLGFGILSNQGYEASFVYLFIYVITMIGLFLLVKFTFFTKNYYLIELGGQNISNKVIAFSWGVFFLSVAGVPPLSGFISKWLILTVVMDYQYIISALIGITFSAIAAGYYLRVLKITYFQKSASYLNWEYIMKPKDNIITFKEYLIGFSIYMSLFLIIHPSSIFTSFYLGFNYFF